MRSMNTSRILLAVFLSLAVVGCGGGGDMEDDPKQTEHVAPPPCKNVPVDQRDEACST